MTYNPSLAKKKRQEIFKLVAKAKILKNKKKNQSLKLLKKEMKDMKKHHLLLMDMQAMCLNQNTL